MSSKNKKYFDVRITGNGSRLEIIKSLQETVDKLKQTPEWLNDIEGQDETLKVEIWRTTPKAAHIKSSYKPSEEEIEEGFFNREAGYEFD